MKLIFFLISLLFVGYIYSQDTIYVTSRFDARLKLYQDSLNAYNIGKSVCENVSVLFYKMTNSSYNGYFLNAWTFSYKEGESPDTNILCFFNFNSVYPDPNEGQQFKGNLVGSEISNEYHRLDTLKVKPYATVSGGEMPTAYIYKDPSNIIIWKKIDRCWEKKAFFTVTYSQTHFITNKSNRTIIPYNLRFTYTNGKLSKEDWIDPVDYHLIKSFSY